MSKKTEQWHPVTVKSQDLRPADIIVKENHHIDGVVKSVLPGCRHHVHIRTVFNENWCYDLGQELLVVRA